MVWEKYISKNFRILLCCSLKSQTKTLFRHPIYILDSRFVRTPVLEKHTQKTDKKTTKKLTKAQLLDLMWWSAKDLESWHNLSEFWILSQKICQINLRYCKLQCWGAGTLFTVSAPWHRDIFYGIFTWSGSDAL